MRTRSPPVAATHDQKLERADLDTAIEVAAGHPRARTATVEVRPFWDAPWDRLLRVAEDTADAPHR